MSATSSGDRNNNILDHYKKILKQVILRAESWESASIAVRKNIKAMADAQLQCAKTLRKISVAPVKLAKIDIPPEEHDTMSFAAFQCFQTLPAQLAAHHEEVAKHLMQVYNGVAGELERQSHKNWQEISSIVFTLWENVEQNQQALKTEQNNAAAVMTASVRLSWALRKERQSATDFCVKVREVYGATQGKDRDLLGGPFRDVFVATVAAVAGPMTELETSLQTLQRGVRGIDPTADWDVFASHGPAAALHGPPNAPGRGLPVDWREWKEEESRLAAAEEGKGDVMSAAPTELVVRAGYLLRQGTIISFNWHRHYFVLTADGFLHYFPSRAQPDLTDSIQLVGRRVEAVVNQGELHLSVWPASDGLFFPARPTRLVLRCETAKDGAAAAAGLLEEWAASLRGFSLPGSPPPVPPVLSCLGEGAVAAAARAVEALPTESSSSSAGAGAGVGPPVGDGGDDGGGGGSGQATVILPSEL